MMNLQKEIDQIRPEIRTDGYTMSIGEWMNLYQNDEIDIHPEFQRFFRWTPEQKTKLIESILLGIPIPPIFVSQRDDGVWDVIDGLQRLSTIFQFAGLLRDEDREIREPLTLQRTDYLPSLEGMKWDDPEDENLSFSQSQRLYVKRAKIDASIILRESDERTKYELFQRLNTGGSPLTSQEVRNCILVMVNRDMYAWMRHLADIDAFKQCVALTDRALNEQYDLELVLRFIIFRTVGVDAIKNIGDLDDFLRVKMVEYAQLDFDRIGEENAFRHTFSLLTNTVGSDCFHKYDERRQKFIGGFLVSAFEAVALGVGYNYVKWNSNNQGLILDKIKSVWSNNDFINNSGSGVRASTRVPRVIPLGRTLFEP